MILKLGMQHRGIKLYKVYINGDPGLTLTYFTARSNLETLAFLLEKVKTVDFQKLLQPVTGLDTYDILMQRFCTTASK